jgi:hypothetical protein
MRPLLSHGLRNQIHLWTTLAECRLPHWCWRVVKVGKILHILCTVRSKECQKMSRNLLSLFDWYEVT